MMMSLPKVTTRWSAKASMSGNESMKHPNDVTTDTPIERCHTSGEMRNQNLRQSFIHAFEGLSHVLWTQNTSARSL